MSIVADAAADIFDGMATSGRPDLRRRWSEEFEVIGAPGGTIAESLLPGDLLVRRALGEGSLAHLSVVSNGEIVTEIDAANAGLTTEARGPGLYVEVTEVGPEPRRRAEGFARRVADPRGRIAADQLVLRRRLTGGLAEAPPLAEQPGPPPACPPGAATQLGSELTTALTATRGLSGLPLTAAAPFCLPTTRCQTQVTNAQLVHHEGLAVDVTTLSKDELRMAQLSGLFGVSLTTVTGNRALVPVRTMPRAAPFQHLSFWALRQGTRRELHVNLTNRHLFGRGPRVVASRVDGAPWACLPIAARPGVAYSLFKLRFNIASLHRQWGRTGAVAWIVGLCNFYRDQNRGLRPGVGDISHIVGEEMADDHRGHREGRDVDLYVLEYPPNALPRAFFCDGAGNVSAFTTPPDPSGVYGPPLLALATVDANLILQKYATFLAYCLATWSNVQVVIWKCANSVRNLARDLALAAFDGGWRASWGPAPSSRQDILTAHRQFNTKVIGDDAHRDHMHVKLVATI